VTDAAQPPQEAQRPQEMQTPQEAQMPQKTQTPREMQRPQEVGIKKVSLEVSRKVSLQMSSPFPRQEVP